MTTGYPYDSLRSYSEGLVRRWRLYRNGHQPGPVWYGTDTLSTAVRFMRYHADYPPSQSTHPLSVHEYTYNWLLTHEEVPDAAESP